MEAQPGDDFACLWRLQRRIGFGDDAVVRVGRISIYIAYYRTDPIVLHSRNHRIGSFIVRSRRFQDIFANPHRGCFEIDWMALVDRERFVLNAGVARIDIKSIVRVGQRVAAAEEAILASVLLANVGDSSIVKNARARQPVWSNEVRGAVRVGQLRK